MVKDSSSGGSISLVFPLNWAQKQPGLCGVGHSKSGSHLPHTETKEEIFGLMRGLSLAPKLALRECIPVCMFFCVPVFYLQSYGLIGLHSPQGLLPFLSKWSHCSPLGCGAACVRWLKYRMGEVLGLPAPAAGASEQACLGLPSPNLTTKSGNRLNPKF